VDWRQRACQEIQGIRPYWSEKYGWAPRSEEHEARIDLYVHFVKKPGTKYLLRLRYEPDFETAGRREAFLSPDDGKREGREFWPEGSAFKTGENPPAICLEGTHGFHSRLHRDRDGRVANLNKLLLEIQKCLNP
jgi:hypothetical protein